MQVHQRALCAAIGLLFAAAAVQAQSSDTLKAAAEKAVASNPDVTARFNAFRAAGEAVSVARAGWLPQIDLNASAGRDWDRIKSRDPASDSLSRTGVGLSLTQLLWDGMGTQREIERAGHDKLSRYFELLETTEQITLEAAKAHFDVQRFRRLVQLAEDNYVQHRFAYMQIQSRYKAGVGRGVDLEQSNARLALAESNLTTELANLHDVTARYQRIVGEAPPATLPALTMLKTGLPASSGEAVGAALKQSPAISASIETLRGARAGVSTRESAYQPRVEARLRTTAGHNVDGIQDQTRNSAAEIVLNWNLFNGGADQGRVRQQVSLVNQAADQRDRACRDVRQTAAIAYNDTRKLTEQLVYLDRNTLAIEKARDAYRQQFDIGQRSLLDLLNSENELYTAKRAYANAEHDLALAYARAHAGMTQLGVQLGLRRDEKLGDEGQGWGVGEDTPLRCPAVSNDIIGTDRAELDARAARIAASVPPPPAPASAPVRK